MKRNRFVFLISFLSVCLFACGIISARAGAEAKTKPQVIRVGWFTIDGYQYMDENGNRSGYGFEYYQEAGKYLDCQYEFVEGSWNECLERLKDGEIDVLSFVQYTAERDTYFDYTEGAIGQNFAVLTARSDDGLIGGDISSIKGKRIGALYGASQIGQFKTWAGQNGVGHYTLKEYEEVDELLEALQNRDIDLVLHNSFRVLEDYEKVIAKFAPNRIYMAVKEGNSVLRTELDGALAEIQLENPYFGAKLTERYYASNTSKVLVLTGEEQEFLKSLPVLKVVSAPKQFPFSYTDDGGFSGINIDILQEAIEKLGLTCEFIHSGSYKDSLDKIKNGEADLVGGFYYDYSWAEENKVRLTSPYMSMQYCIMSRKSMNLDRQKEWKIAAARGFRFSKDYVQRYYQADQIVWYDSVEACIQALNRAEVDVTFTGAYTAEHYLKDYQYSNLTSSMINYRHDLTIAVSNRQPPLLSYLLGKALISLGTDEINSVVTKHTAFHTEDIGWLRIFYVNPVLSTSVIFAAGLLLVLLLVIIVHGKTKYGKKLMHIINTDRVTDGMSYEKFRQEADRYLEKAEWEGYALVYLDLQNFKYINDTFGHLSGDGLLKTISKLSLETVREDELTARVYADHYVMLLRNEESQQGRRNLVSRLEAFWRELDRRTEELNHYSTFFKTGVYQIHRKNTSIDKAVDAAIYALHTPGTISENTVVFYDNSMRDCIHKEKMLERDMNQALERHEFEAYYQPKVDVVTKRIIGSEALVRWNHPEKGMIPPGDFIPFFEKNNFITKLDIYMFEEVCRDQYRLLEMGIIPLTVSVNFSRRHLRVQGWADKLVKIADRYGLSHELFELELTETVAEENFDLVHKTVEELRSYGFKISIDDFGSGYSSVQLLYRIPIDVLKLDKSYFHDGETAKIEQEVILGIIQVANQNGIQVIWEGVETLDQEKMIQQYGCRYAQGFLYAKPMPFQDYVAAIEGVV